MPLLKNHFLDEVRLSKTEKDLLMSFIESTDHVRVPDILVGYYKIEIRINSISLLCAVINQSKIC